MAGKFTVAVNNDGTLAKPFNNGGALDFISKNGIAKQTDLTSAIAAIKTFSVQVVDELPETGKEKVIYLVPATNTKDKNIKDEYLWINGTWEQIGTTAINLDEVLEPINEDIATNTNNIKALMEAFPTENPNIIYPKASVSLDTNKELYEVGTTADIKITSGFTPGKYSPKYKEGEFNSKTDGTFPFCGDAISCKIWMGVIYEDSDLLLPESIQTNVFSTTISKTFEFTKYNIYSEISYTKLTDPVYNNKGDITGVTQPSTLSGTAFTVYEETLYGTLPIYGTTSTIDKLTKQSAQIRSDRSTVEITLVAQTSKDNLQMILIPQDWCGDDGVSSIGQYNEIFNTYDVITNDFGQVPNVTWELDSSSKLGIRIPTNDYITDNYLYPDISPIDTSRKYALLINTSGNVGERKIQITK